jgi:hypothetical protein
VVRQRALDPPSAGSNPAAPTKTINDRRATIEKLR